MKIHLLIITVFFCLCSYAQDPGHVLEVKITEAGKTIKGEDLKKFKVVLARVYANEQVLKENSDSTFFWFDWNFFGRQVHELKINKGSDEMIIRFAINPDSVYQKGKHLLTERLYFNMPFLKGYYEVTDFKNLPKNNNSSAAELFIKENHNWIDLPENKRKLK